EGLEGYTYLE
ncbi:MAG TPA: hypothetical protein DD676_01090, partial [Halomonas sp.]|nr:hypothetical protein [Halomonas sp.]